MDRLEYMLDSQRELQKRILGVDPATLDNDARINNIKMNSFALMAELFEAVNEIGWKEWATSRHINRKEFCGELVDVWHFLMNMMIAVDMDADALFDGYNEKRIRNHARQENGYDGVSGKCSACHRDLEEITIKKVPSRRFLGQGGTDYHCICGQFLMYVNA
jgi:hypothetical protein